MYDRRRTLLVDTFLCELGVMRLSASVRSDTGQAYRGGRIAPGLSETGEPEEPGELGVGVPLVSLRPDPYVHNLGDLLAAL